MQRIIFDYTPAFLLLAVAIGAAYAWVLYSAHHPWSKRTNQWLFAIRAVLVTLLAGLLLGPIIKFILNETEPPAVAVLIDNSASVGQALGATGQAQLRDSLDQLTAGWEDEGMTVTWFALDGRPTRQPDYTHPTSDLQGALNRIMAAYEGKNLSHVVLVSDGIYNAGVSPLYHASALPLHALAVGDSAKRKDIAIKTLAYNKITYQGNRFPLRTEVAIHGYTNTDIKVQITSGGKVVHEQVQRIGQERFFAFTHLLEAAQEGIQKIEVRLAALPGEANTQNNAATAFVEVVKGRKKIALVAPAPHPDLKALRTVLEKNSNYEVVLFIPEVSTPSLANSDLYIFHQVADVAERTAAILEQAQKSGAGLVYIVGSQTNLARLPAKNVPLSFESSGQRDEVMPVINNTFADFMLPEAAYDVLNSYPPVSAPFGKFTFPAQASVLLHQKIGSVVTPRPLLMMWREGDQRLAALVGEGFWRWRLQEHRQTQKTDVFDELFAKLFQYISTAEDKRKFRSFPLKSEFSTSEPVWLESQVFNDLFEPVFGNEVNLILKNEKGKTTAYNYKLAPGAQRYRINGLPEGVYQYTATTTRGGPTESISGQFVVRNENWESQNTEADFLLLARLAGQSGGKFATLSQAGSLRQLASTKAPSRLHSTEEFVPLINLKWVFVLLAVLVSAEWFTRKYAGGY
jgi:hypothetical protein